MQIKSAIFSLSAQNIQAAPDSGLKEFAFIGRSNVGKSSIINMLSNKTSLAKVSATPGKTQLINFFLINESWSLVDLPGYGYAKIAKSQKIDFNKSVGDYIANRENLIHLFVLIDSRLPPQVIDLNFIQWLLDYGIDFSIVFTKVDKQSAKKSQSNADDFLSQIPSLSQESREVIFTSSKAKQGRVQILKKIETILAR